MRSLSASLALVAFLATPAIAQQALPGQRGVPAVSCGPSNSSPACQDIRQAIPGGAIPGVVERSIDRPPPTPLPRPDMDDVRAQRLVPPGVRQFLNDPRIDPVSRAFLTGIAGKDRDAWTMHDYQMISALIPTLTEMRISTATLSAFYEFMGLDPANLFEPQLGDGWQTSSTPFDPRTRFRRNSRCAMLSQAARADPTVVRVRDLLTCADE
ncbi:hypothetical protein [Belnapia sp. F-4-1]|uniref:hypothetical protein n=1 Tax=Belnapia sp. F-4-1 TaxID=1545443 RepID=UPI0005BC658A|nr:hypothetical protein [Belnapia sp. F-4-1]